MSENLPSPEEGEEKNLLDLLIESCQDVLTPEDIAELAEMEFDEALGYVFTLLIEAGIEDPEEFFKEKGLLE